jgi:hypothetical protein
LLYNHVEDRARSRLPAYVSRRTLHTDRCGREHPISEGSSADCGACLSGDVSNAARLSPCLFIVSLPGAYEREQHISSAAACFNTSDGSQLGHRRKVDIGVDDEGDREHCDGRQLGHVKAVAKVPGTITARIPVLAKSPRLT